MGDLQIEVDQREAVTVIKLTGRLDHNTAPQFEAVLTEQTTANRFKLVLDFSNLSYISSAGNGVLLRIRKVVKRWQRGDVRFGPIHPYTKEQLSLLGFNIIFDMYDTVEAAVASF